MPSREELRQRAEANEPLVDTFLLDMWAELDPPFRGERRQNILERMRAQARNRRTVEGISSRIAVNISSPVTNAIQEEVEDRTQARVKGQLEKAVDQSDRGNE